MRDKLLHIARFLGLTAGLPICVAATIVVAVAASSVVNDALLKVFGPLTLIRLSQTLWISVGAYWLFLFLRWTWQRSAVWDRKA